MGIRKSKIVQPGDGEVVQMGLFSAANTGDTSFLSDYPPVHRDKANFMRVVEDAGDFVGLDFEFSTSTLKPTIIGISNDKEAVSCYFDIELLRWLEEQRQKRGFRYSGHAVLTADRQVLEKALSTRTPSDAWSDSMLTFWLAHAHLCKAPQKDEDADGGLGFMGLGTMVSVTTDLPNHKNCRGRDCEEVICPRHDVRGYCAIDAYGGMLGDIVSRKILADHNVPPEAITFAHEMQELTSKMTERGMAVDHDYVEKLGASMSEQQEKLFPAEGEDGFVFNPRSPKAVVEWARENKIFLPKADKDAVWTVLERLSREHGYEAEKADELCSLLEVDEESLDPVLKTIYHLYTYKVLGKGTDPWFHERYFGKDGLLHPRFVVTGTSTGRFSSSRPNIQNVPKRGWGKLVRKAFIPREDGHLMVEADFSQLELRICLYLAGVDQSVIGADAFSWLVSKSDGLFAKAADRFGGTPRDIAKSISHGGNYMEGFKLISGAELELPRYKKEIEAGALRVYHPRYMDGLEKEWTFCGKVVCFTGSNLAQRLFKSKTVENRRKALEIQEDIYFAAFPMIRDWQRKELAAAENRGYVQAPTGRFLRLLDTPEKNAKLIVAFLGQGVGASYAQAVMLDLYKEHGLIMNSQIHDAFVQEMEPGDLRKVYETAMLMARETKLLPGFSCPAKVEVGPNWGEMKELLADGTF